ncbi:recombinase family protein [Salmonella enterica]|uniref:Recombinase family protein n=1 Tax=Salmonella oranienberg TaxID=28147 RepID=A0A730ENE0_SALON|nr:recombinase family protein [Salmonella enterica]HAE3750279.1 recombinase family protein [Salmonella enterica subsp. enterica serovar Oranienburg]EJI0902746.1 recombinase family protein [Salmonella enterica]ELL4277547.1 recombinase family protein [Salmonella enterica]HBX1359038.1 recombinase family protein [Salmonella enterica]
MALLGYARVSTSQQKLALQIDELKNAGVREDRIFTDMMTGATDEREGLQRLLGRAEKDDIIICTKMDRLGRNTADMIHIVDACYKKGIAIRFLENGLSTEGTMGKMVIQILAAVAEAERERILERTNEGRVAAMAAGIRFGRKPHPLTSSVLSLIEQEDSVKSIQDKTGISRATYFRLKKTLSN